ncbi:WAP four-disulfide core domain protein 1 [Homalodisca vitripennis]|nr:WAP four-disulfide core domain protein 1 [Homalodisca vitripennis]
MKARYRPIDVKGRGSTMKMKKCSGMQKPEELKAQKLELCYKCLRRRRPDLGTVYLALRTNSGCDNGQNLTVETPFEAVNKDYVDDSLLDCAFEEEVQTLSKLLVAGQKPAVPWSSLCPPPVKPLSATACSAHPCTANSECSPRRNHTYICCFNGCVDTCMRALDPPPVFDWIEDEPHDMKQFGVPGKVASHSSPPESVALPGGCVITPSQFVSLEGFKQNEHVSDW